MAFLDKVSAFAKSTANKTNDMIETTKLNSKIGDLKKEIGKLKAELGDCMFEQFAAGAVYEGKAAEICENINVCLKEIENIEEQIRKIKEEEDTPKTEAPKEAAAPGEVKFCPECGTKTNADAKFCGSCGHKF